MAPGGPTMASLTVPVPVSNETDLIPPGLGNEIVIAGWITVCLIAILLILMVVILFSNGMVIGLYIRDRQLRVPANTFIFMLCIVDLIVGLNIPLVIASTVNPRMWADSKWCAYKYATINNFIFVSLHLQVGVAFDRLIAIAKPFHYVKVVSVRCSFLTSLAFFAYCAGMFYAFPILWRNEDSLYCFVWRTLKTLYQLAVAIPHYVILFTLLVFCYARIFRVARHACQHRPPTVCPGPTGAVTMETEMKAARTLLLVVGLIFVTWFPYFLSFFLFHVRDETPALVHFGTVVAHLPYLNSAWNPWIYAIRLPAFRAAIRRLLRKRNTGTGSSRRTSPSTQAQDTCSSISDAVPAADVPSALKAGGSNGVRNHGNGNYGNPLPGKALRLQRGSCPV